MIAAATALTVAQFARLDSVDREDPAAKIVGWAGGPVIRRSDGRVQRLVPNGRLNAVRNPTEVA